MIIRVIISILVFLMASMGAAGAYSYTVLKQQIKDLSQQLSGFQSEQAIRMAGITDELTAFRGESLKATDRLGEAIDENIADTAILGEELVALDGEIGANLAKIGSVQKEVSEVSGQLSRSALKAIEVYQEASQAVVRITDGQRVIGSGFIIDGEGHVVTAHHVVKDLDEIEVILADGSISAATLTGSSPPSDTAILTLENRPTVRPLRFADSTTLLVGQPVVSIGSPLDLTGTLTSGVISQLNRYIEIESDSQERPVANLIQFDAPVNPGNSGCPLLNSSGEVVGMVIARISPNQGDGIYYAVSSNKLQKVTRALINQGTFDYPWLGLEITDLTPQEARKRGLDTINGVLITRVTAGSPAAAGGLKINDIMVTMDGEAVRNIADLASYLGEYKSPNQAAVITVIRGGARLERFLTIGKQPS